MSLRLLLPTLLALLSSTTGAQSVTLQGKVEDVQGTANRFRVACTGTELTSATIDLNAFLDATVEIDGQWNGSSASPSVEVLAITPVAETFEISGGAKIGDTSQLSFTGNFGDLAVGILSRSPGFVPFGGANGVIFIRLQDKVLKRTGTIGPTGILELPFFIPNDPALVGLEMYGQGALVGGGVRMTNPDCKTIDA